jgi:hypothetical protein
MIRTRWIMSLAACLITCVVPLASAATSALAEDMRQCGTHAEEKKRLACFDSLVATLPKIEADQFGMTRDLAVKRDPVRERKADDSILPGKIIALGQGQHGQLVFTLDNKQVWVQAEVEPSKIFSVGEDVHIEHGAMGTLWLAADHARKTRVKRIS